MSAFSFSELWEIIDKYAVTFDCVIPKPLLCLICNKVLRNCKKLPCECRFCSNCLQIYINNGNSCCPGKSDHCRDEKLILEQEFEVDNNINDEIGKLMMKCVFNGCIVKECAKNMPNHILECEFFIDSCHQCGCNLRRCDLVEHLHSECSETSLPCDYCHILMSRKQRDTVHYNVNNDGLCDLYESSCPNHCSDNIIVKVKEHLRVCPNRSISCPYFDVGCRSDILQSLIENHLCKEGYCHTGLLLQKINNLGNYVHRLRTTVEEVNSKIALLEDEFRQVKFENESLRDQMTVRNSGASMSEDRDEIRQQISVITALSERMDQCDFRYGTKYIEYIWRLSEFKDIRTKAKNDVNYSVTSEEFITSKNGYKVQMILFPNGFQRAKNRYMSLYFKVIKDKFDALLPWPFRQNVELSLLDQDGANDRVEILFYDPTNETMMDNYQRPFSTDVRMYGSQEFAPLTLLQTQPGLRKNDCIFIKFCAKPVTLID